MHALLPWTTLHNATQATQSTVESVSEMLPCEANYQTNGCIRLNREQLTCRLGNVVTYCILRYYFPRRYPGNMFVVSLYVLCSLNSYIRHKPFTLASKRFKYR